LVQKT